MAKVLLTITQIVCVSLLILAAACSQRLRQETAITPIAETQPTTMIIAQSIVYYDSFYELTEHADIVIIGRALKAIETLNAARAPGEAAKPDPEHYGIGEIYQVEVEDYQKGAGPKTLYVLVARGLMSVKDDRAPSADEIESVQKASGVAPLDPTKRYLMFLDRSSHIYPGYEDTGVYVGIAHPWLFDLSDPNCVRYQDANDFQGNYLPQSLATIEALIHAALAGEQAPVNAAYPPPVSASECLPLETQPYP